MPYISSEEVKSMREELKKAFPEYKLSVTRRHMSTVVVAIMEGPMEFEKGHFPVNQYYIQYTYKDQPEMKALFQKIMDVIQGKKKVEIVSPDTDYGDWPNYYIDLSVGKWDKDYKKKGA